MSKDDYSQLEPQKIAMKLGHSFLEIDRGLNTQGLYGGVNPKNYMKKLINNVNLSLHLVEIGLGMKPEHLYRLSDKFWKKMRKETEKELNKWLVKKRNS